ncbi:Small ribosomal subunit protein uS9c [Orobanche hederae]
MAMTTAISSLTSSLSSLSFSSQISNKPVRSLSFSSSKPLSLKSIAPKLPTIIVASAVADSDFETADLKKLVKSRLPGGFAAQNIIGTGRRKCAIARVVLQEGSGKIIINYRDAKPLDTTRITEMNVEYLQGNPLWLQYVKTPLVTLGFESSYDVFVKAHGGGLSGQAQAITLGIARALLKVSGSHRAHLKQEGLLTRDPRVVERKKVGLRKARKRPQYSKR